MRGARRRGTRAAAAGAHRRRAGCSAAARTEIVVGKSIAERFDGAGIGETPALRRARLDRGRRVRRRRLGFDSEIWGDGEQMMQAFRRNAYSSVVARLARPGAVRRGQGAARGRPAAHARREARAALLRGAVGGALELHQHPRPHAVGHLLDRRDDRRDDHDVRRGRQPHRRDRHAARARLQARRDSGRVPRRGARARRCSAGRSGSRSPRSCSSCTSRP